MIKNAPQAKRAAQIVDRHPKLASMKRVAQPKIGVPTESVKRPVAPAVYKPQAQPKIAQARKVAPAQARVSAQGIKRAPVAPPVFRPQTTPPVAQPKNANGTGNRKPPVAPPVYRPQQTPKVLQAKKWSGQQSQGAQKLRQPVAASPRRQTIQRMEKVPGFPGFFEGSLPEEHRGGTFNTVWSQVEPMEVDDDVMSHSSVKFSKKSKQHLVEFAKVGHIEDEENTHAEDRLSVTIQQRAIEIYYQTEALPSVIKLPEFFVSASPCSSTFGTSSKGTGCTENLIAWATKGLLVESEEGCKSYVKVAIGTLVVNKLYKSNSYDGASGSMAALILMKKKGAIGGWRIETDPPLDTGKIKGYKKTG
jgi:hypothetical protein